MRFLIQLNQITENEIKKVFLDVFLKKKSTYRLQEFAPHLRSHYNIGAIGGELSAELPFILMHPKPNMKKIMKADTMNDNTDYKAQFIY